MMKHHSIYLRPNRPARFLRLQGLFLLFLLLSLTVGLSACSGKTDPLATSSFSALRIGSDGSVTAEISLDLRTVQAHTGERICLYEFLPGEALTSAAGKTPVAEAKVASSVRMSFPLVSGGHTGLYSIYGVGFSDGSLAGLFRVPDNPAPGGVRDNAFPRSASRKAVANVDASVADSMQMPHFIAEVRFSDLLAASGIRFTFEDTEYAVSSAVIEGLDRQFSDAAQAGMQSSLRIIPDASVGAAQKTALIDFFAARWCVGEDAGVTAFFVDVRELSAPEEAALFCRIANHALLSRTSAGRVYLVRGDKSLSALSAFYENTAECLAAIGDIRFGAAVVPAGDVLPWERVDPDLTAVQNLSGLLSAWQEAKFAPSRLAVTDLSYASAAGEGAQTRAAAYADAYAQAASAGAGMIVFRAGDGEAETFLTAAENAALVRLLSEMDTGISSEDLFLLRSVSVDAAERVAALSPDCRRLSGVASAGAGSGNGSYLFDFSKGDLFGFSAVGGAADPELKSSAAWNRETLFAWLLPSAPRTGLRKTMSGEALAGISSLALQVSPQYANVGSCTLTLCLEGTGTDGTVLRYEASATVENNRWQTVTYNIALFTVDMDPDLPCILSVLVSPEAGAEEGSEPFGFWMRGILVSAPEKEANVIPFLLGGAGIVLTVGLVFLCYRISVKKSRKRRD